VKRFLRKEYQIIYWSLTAIGIVAAITNFTQPMTAAYNYLAFIAPSLFMLYALALLLIAEFDK
jgi:hypothetical protein